MAANWIKWTKGLASRREVAVIAAHLNRDRHEIAGRLMVLWEWCDDNFSDDDVLDLSLDVSLILGDTSETARRFIDQITGLTGLAAAMSLPSVGWIAVAEDGRVVFPKLARNNGNTAKTRATGAEKKKRQRDMSPKVSPEKRDDGPDEKGTKSGPDKIREEKKRIEETREDPATPGSAAHLSPGGDASAEDSTSPASVVANVWNAMSGCTPCRKVSDARRRAAKARMADAHFRDNWKDAINRVAQSDFCRGLTGDRGWTADIDWFLRPDTVLRIMEGKFDNKINGSALDPRGNLAAGRQYLEMFGDEDQ